jgi:hypothetical protein
MGGTPCIVKVQTHKVAYLFLAEAAFRGKEDIALTRMSLFDRPLTGIGETAPQAISVRNERAFIV